MGKLVPPDNHAGVLGTLVPSRDPISSPQSPQDPALLPLMEKLQRQCVAHRQSPGLCYDVLKLYQILRALSGSPEK